MAALGIVILAGADLQTKRRVFHAGRTAARLSPLLNPGAARSLNIAVPIIILVSACVCVGLIALYYNKLITRRPFILLMAGALGNIYDRIVFNGVRDRIHVGIFPVFNIADVLITLGVVLIALDYKRKSREERAK